MASAALKIEAGTEIPGEGDEVAVETTERDFEAEAKEHGWSPKEEFKGDVSRWVDAETFMKRADEMMPLLKSQRDRYKREFESLRKDVKRMSAHMEGAEKRAYERAMADLERQHAQAVEGGDLNAANAAVKEMRELAPATGWAVGKSPAEIKEEAVEALDAIREEHPWYDRANLAGATELEISARTFYDRMVDKNLDKTEDMPPAEFFAYIAGLTLDKYPALKSSPTRIKPASAVEAGGVGPKRGTAQTWDNLPDDARRQYQRFIDRGLLGVKSSGDTAKDVEASRKYYARSHDWKGYAA